MTLEDLAACQWVLPRSGTPTRDRFHALFDSHPAPPLNGLVETSSLVLIRELLMGSDRLTLISRHQIRHEQDLGLLVPLSFPMPQTDRPIGLTLRREWRPTATQQRFLTLLRRAGREAARYSKNE